jgi:hypothetical protein
VSRKLFVIAAAIIVTIFAVAFIKKDREPVAQFRRYAVSDETIVDELGTWQREEMTLRGIQYSDALNKLKAQLPQRDGWWTGTSGQIYEDGWVQGQEFVRPSPEISDLENEHQYFIGVVIKGSRKGQIIFWLMRPLTAGDKLALKIKPARS